MNCILALTCGISDHNHTLLLMVHIWNNSKCLIRALDTTVL